MFGFYKTRYMLLSDSANCTVLRAVVLTQYRCVTDRQTDGQTDGIAVASTALTMPALRRAVKISQNRARDMPVQCTVAIIPKLPKFTDYGPHTITLLHDQGEIWFTSALRRQMST